MLYSDCNIIYKPAGTWGVWPVWAGRFHPCEHLLLAPPPRACTLRSHSAPESAPTSPTCALPHSTWGHIRVKPVQKAGSRSSDTRRLMHTMFSTISKVCISITGQLQRAEAQFCVHLSRNVRVLAWIMLRSHSAGFLPGSACLCPNTSMATAPSVRYSIKSSVTVTACSYSTDSITKVNAC